MLLDNLALSDEGIRAERIVTRVLESALGFAKSMRADMASETLAWDAKTLNLDSHKANLDLIFQKYYLCFLLIILRSIDSV